jgi:hypothetical protein
MQIILIIKISFLTCTGIHCQRDNFLLNAYEKLDNDII